LPPSGRCAYGTPVRGKSGPSLVRERSVLRPCKVLDDWRRHVDPSKGTQEIASHQAHRLHRWTQDRRLSRRCVLEHLAGNRTGPRCNGVADGYRDRKVTPRGKPVLRDPPVRTRPGPFKNVRALGRCAYGTLFAAVGPNFGPKLKNTALLAFGVLKASRIA
jgi:hypothetical protein